MFFYFSQCHILQEGVALAASALVSALVRFRGDSPSALREAYQDPTGSMLTAWLIVPGLAYSFIERERRLATALSVNLPHTLLILLFVPENYDDPRFLGEVVAPIALAITAQGAIHTLVATLNKRRAKG